MKRPKLMQVAADGREVECSIASWPSFNLGRQPPVDGGEGRTATPVSSTANLPHTAHRRMHRPYRRDGVAFRISFTIRRRLLYSRKMRGAVSGAPGLCN